MPDDRDLEGALFFGYFLLGKQKKVTGRQGCRSNPQGCESVFANHRTNEGKVKMDSGLRRNDNRRNGEKRRPAGHNIKPPPNNKKRATRQRKKRRRGRLLRWG